MTQEDKIIKNKLGVLRLVDMLGNVVVSKPRPRAGLVVIHHVSLLETSDLDKDNR